MFTKDLEKSISAAYRFAREMHHEFLTVEHLLLGLLQDPSAQEVLLACEADVELLERDLRDVLAETVPELPANDQTDTQPTVGF